MSYKDTTWRDPRTGKPKDAPCAYYGWSEAAQKDVLLLPTVNCNGMCGKCGYNPEVKAKRLAARKPK